MRSLLESTDPSAAALVTSKLRLIWKSPDTRRYHEIGQFEALSDGRYAFGYRPDASQVPGFHPLLQFPELTEVYLSDVWPAFFANRVMSPNRPSFENHLEWLGLKSDATPIEILARTGGPRATDTFHLVDSFEPHAGRCEGVFFVSGIRYQDYDISLLQSDEELGLLDDPTNEFNDRAILLTARGSELGWVPDWLVADIHRYRAAGGAVRVFVEKVNRDAPPHLAVRCRLVMTGGREAQS